MCKENSEQGWVLWLIHEIPALGSESKASLGSIEQANLIKEKYWGMKNSEV